MNWREDLAGESPELETALNRFKASMDAWSSTASSDAAYRDRVSSRPRTTAKIAVRRSWRPAASWALGCLLAVGSLTVAAHEIVHRQETAKLAAQKAARKAAEVRAAAEQEAALHAQTAAAVEQEAGARDEDLLASVDKDVSRQVPAAMEPLAQLMDDNGVQ